MQAQDSRVAARLTALYEAHATDVFRYALHLTGRREDAEDIVQFVFLQAFGTLEAGTELMHPRAWLIKAAKHRSLNMLRDRREAPTAEADLPLVARDAPDPEEAAALAAVRSTLWALPESQHQAFVLRHWSGLSQDEIADVLETTTGAVESLLIRARRTLLEDQNQISSECSRVRNRLVEALAPSADQRAHIANCRRCRTAQSRLLRASEFASVLVLVPRPWVAHALGSAVPGFGAGGAAAATTMTGATAVTGAAGGGAGAGATAATAATKIGVIAKVGLATATAVVALGATHPVRSTVSGALFGGRPAHSVAAGPRSRTPIDPTGATAQNPPAPSGAPGQGDGAGAGGNGKGNGKANGKSATAGANGNGNAKPHGKSATAGANGNGNAKPHGKSATAGANGKGNAKPHGKSATAGANGNGKAKGKANGAAGNGQANGQANGKAKGAAGNGQAKGQANGNGNGNGKGAPKS